VPSLVQPITVSCVLTIQMLLLGYAANQILGIWNKIPEPAQNIWLKIFFGLSVGFAVDTTALFVLGLAGWLNGIASIATLATITFLAALQLKPQLLVRPRLSHFLSINATMILTGVLLLFVIVLLSAIRAPGLWDDTNYHLPLAQHYLDQRQISLQPYLRFPLFPQNMELLFALGLMTGGSQFGGEIVAQFLASVPLFIASIGLIGALRWTAGVIWPSFFASVLLLGLGPVRQTLGYAYIDNGLLLYCWATLLAVALNLVYCTKRWRRPWLLMAGLMAGMTMGTKYFGVVLISLPGLWLLTVRRDWRGAFVYGGTTLLFGSWWYIRAWLISGDPIHPEGGRIFGYFLWDAQDLIGQMGDQATYDVKGFSNLWSSMKTAGVGVFALVPLSLIYWRRLGPGLTMILAAIVCYFGFWFYVAQTNRYLAPIVAAAVFFSIWSLWQIGQTFTQKISILGTLKIPHSKTAGAFLCALAPLALVNNAWAESRYQYQNWEEILQQTPGYSLMQRANELIPHFGNRLINVGFENAVFFYNGIAIGDWFGPGRYRQMILQCSDVCKIIPPEGMRQVMLHFHAFTLLVNLRFFEIDLSAYQREFTLEQLTPDGALLTLNSKN
jgi:hypothetical protein